MKLHKFITELVNEVSTVNSEFEKINIHLTFSAIYDGSYHVNVSARYFEHEIQHIFYREIPDICDDDIIYSIMDFMNEIKFRINSWKILSDNFT